MSSTDRVARCGVTSDEPMARTAPREAHTPATAPRVSAATELRVRAKVQLRSPGTGVCGVWMKR
eukprot:5307800-Prymnesium_polylepis.1